MFHLKLFSIITNTSFLNNFQLSLIICKKKKLLTLSISFQILLLKPFRQSKYILFLIFFGSLKAYSQKPDSRIDVLLLGTFHFANPGLDVIKLENSNVHFTLLNLNITSFTSPFLFSSAR